MVTKTLDKKTLHFGNYYSEIHLKVDLSKGRKILLSKAWGLSLYQIWVEGLLEGWTVVRLKLS